MPDQNFWSDAKASWQLVRKRMNQTWDPYSVNWIWSCGTWLIRVSISKTTHFLMTAWNSVWSSGVSSKRYVMFFKSSVNIILSSDDSPKWLFIRSKNLTILPYDKKHYYRTCHKTPKINIPLMGPNCALVLLRFSKKWSIPRYASPKTLLDAMTTGLPNACLPNNCFEWP